MVKHGSRGRGSQAPVGKSVAVQAPLMGTRTTPAAALRALDPAPETMRAQIEAPNHPRSRPPAPGT